MAASINVLRSVLRCRLTTSFRPRLGASSVLARWLHMQEYQSKKLMADNAVAVQRFEVVSSVEEARDVTDQLKCSEYVIKAMVLAGGRGKGVFDNGFQGGVHLTKDPKKIPDIVEKMVGHRIVTKQTNKEGVKVNKVMVAEALDIAREAYFAILLDTGYDGPVMIGSKHGGMDIEELAHKDPDSIFKVPIDIITGVTQSQCTDVAEKLGFAGGNIKTAAEQIKRLYELFVKVDATQVEINPFGETPDGKVVCFDAKITFDDNAAFRQKEIFAMDDQSEMDPREAVAEKLGVNYVGLEGSIGCMVNGAGLAMATLDIIKLHNGEAANFLDVAGGVSEQQVFDSFTLLSADVHVKVILVNVFGGIVNCVTVANGIINAAKKINLKIPLVVRVEGNNVEEAKRILQESELHITPADDLEDAAIKAVKALP